MTQHRRIRPGIYATRPHPANPTTNLRLQGIAAALGNLAGAQMEPDLAKIVLHSLGITVADLKAAGATSPKGQKTDSQRAELEAWLKRHRHKGVQWFEDHDSGASLQRDAFQKFQSATFAGTIPAKPQASPEPPLPYPMPNAPSTRSAPSPAARTSISRRFQG
jgi:hypothetical protein